MRERLIELLKQGRKEYSRQGIARALRSMEEKDWCKGREAQVCDLLEFLADYLLENGGIVLPCQKGAVLIRNGEECVADHWNVLLTAFSGEHHLRLFNVEEAENALKEREKE